MKAIVCGAGIPGLSLAWSLARDGWDIVLVERAPGPREEGYMIDFFGSGYDAAERMGLIDAIRAKSYVIDEVVFADRDGRAQAFMSYKDFRDALGGKLLSLMRGDLERVLHDALPAGVERRYGCTITEFANRPNGVTATLGDGTEIEADLLVGADGIHSTVRERTFGPERRFVRDLGMQTAAFVFADETARNTVGSGFKLVSMPKLTAGLYALRGGRVAAFLVHGTGKGAPLPSDKAATLRAVYHPLGWIVPTALAHLNDGPIYYDHVAQIEMPHWQKDRVVLVGDACAAVSLLAGQGASMGMAMAYVLAEELRGAKDISTALKRYERRLKPELRSRQKSGRGAASTFLPRNNFQLWLRNAAFNLARMRMFSWLLTPLLLSGAKSFIR